MALPVLTPVSQMSKVILPVTGNTANVVGSALPFGIYTSTDYWTQTQVDMFKTGAAEQVTYTYKKLGGDVLDIELVEGNVYAAYEEAVLEYSYLINLHQSKNLLPFVLGQATGTFNNDGQLTGSSAALTNVNLAFPKMTFSYAKNIAIGVSNEALLNGNEPVYSASFDRVAAVQDYDLQTIISGASAANGWDVGNKRITVRRVYYKSPGASWNFYGYFGGLNVVGNLSTYGQYADDSTFEIIPAWQNKLQAMAYEDAIKTRVSDWSFQIRDNKLRLFPVPNEASPSNYWVEFTVPRDAWSPSVDSNGNPMTDSVNGINNMNTIPLQNIPYDKINSIGKQWIRRFALAVCKEILGHVRSKFSTVPIPGDNVTLDGKDLISEAKTDQKDLREELKTLLSEMTYAKIGEDGAKMMEDTNKTQGYVPNLIFVG
jgi:hypothetical protein